MNEEELYQERVINEVFKYAADLMVNQDMSKYEVKELLIKKGLKEESASIIVEKIEDQIYANYNKKAGRDMLIGGIICAIGIILTIGKSGFIFYGAIIFGGIKFFSGLSKYMKS